MRPTVASLALAVVLAACGADPAWNLASADVRPLVERPGDQIHPSLEGRWLAWFDLEDDPNGKCFVPLYCTDTECDGTCQGRIKSMDLLTGRVTTLSEVLSEEVAPTVRAGRVAWLCRDAGGAGLCVSPASHDERTFLSEVGWDQYYQDPRRAPALAGDQVVWSVYRYNGSDSRFRLMRTELDGGASEELLALAAYPSEVVYDGSQVAWVTTLWQDGAYRFTLEALDLSSQVRRVVRQTDRMLFGLGAAGGRLAWKEGQVPGEPREVHVVTLDDDGQCLRVDSQAALVSEESPVVVGDEVLLWLDYRDGPYRIAAGDLAAETEELITPEEAVLGAYQPPTAWGRRVVWSDLRSDDWDLYLYQN